MKLIGTAFAFYNEKQVACFIDIDFELTENYVSQAPLPVHYPKLKMIGILESSQFAKYNITEDTLLHVIIQHETRQMEGDFYIIQDLIDKKKYHFKLKGGLTSIE